MTMTVSASQVKEQETVIIYQPALFRERKGINQGMQGHRYVSLHEKILQRQHQGGAEEEQGIHHPAQCDSSEKAAVHLNSPD